MPILDHFNLIAPYYDRFISDSNFSHLLDYARLPEQGAILDAGGGTGRLSHLLSGERRQVILVDLAYEMLRQAKVKGNNIPVCSYVEELPFGERMFDRVIMVDALHHIRKQTPAIRELWRVLNSGGIAIIEEPNIHIWFVKIIAFLEKALFMHSKFFTGNAIARLFDFQDAKVKIEYWQSSVIIVAEKEAQKL
jgi:demethylmenaquinone methyltransferase/2-methoxy-6-polyprenyl-1,4-benzoquinol methylase